MLSREEYIQISLEINLFFQRIMKEHMLLIETHLPPIDTALITEADVLKRSMEQILSETVILANGNISEDAIKSHAFVTKYTLRAEEVTSTLTGASINTNITMAELKLEAGTPRPTPWLETAVDDINRRTLNLVEEIIKYKEKLFGCVLECKVFLMIYPVMLEHLINEAKHFEEILRNLIDRKLPNFTLCEELNFWNHIMGQHAEFIDGMLDPTEKELKEKAEEFAVKFEKLVEECIKTSEKLIIQKSLKATEEIKDFKESSTIGLLECKIKSIIPPILADHVLREAYYYIWILKHKI